MVTILSERVVCSSKKILQKLENECKQEWKWKDVKAIYIDDRNEEILEKCPRGCNLEVRKVKGWPSTNDGWCLIENEESGGCCKKTLFCEEHSYVRIYVTRGIQFESDELSPNNT